LSLAASFAKKQRSDAGGTHKKHDGPREGHATETHPIGEMHEKGHAVFDLLAESEDHLEHVALTHDEEISFDIDD